MLYFIFIDLGYSCIYSRFQALKYAVGISTEKADIAPILKEVRVFVTQWCQCDMSLPWDQLYQKKKRQRINQLHKIPHIKLWVQCLSSIQFSCSVMSDSVTPWIAARQASRSITNSQSSLRLTSIESVMPSSHLIFCHPLLLPPIPPSIRVFQWVGRKK